MNLRRISKLVILGAAWLAIETRISHGQLHEINPPTAVSDAVALVGAQIVDGRGGQPIQNAVVVIEHGKIVAVGPPDAISLPDDIQQINLAGCTVLPGFVDCHFHSTNDLNPPATFLRHGVTSFRDPGHPFRFYQAVLQAKQPMPRVFLCGGHLDAYPPIWPDQAVLIDSLETAQAAVKSHVKNGATAIKIYFRLPLEYFSTICETADQYQIPVTAHLELVRAAAAISAGVDGIEHVTSFGTSLANTNQAERFEQIVAETPRSREHQRYRLWAQLELTDNPRLPALLQQITEQAVVVSPTLAVFERRSDFADVEDFEVLGFANMLSFVTRCHEAGANIVVGSHTWVPGAEFGWAFHREMELLVECGLSPVEVLSAATLQGAKFLGAADRLGSLEAGKQADLVVVQGDPTRDITEARNIVRVMLAGRWIELE